MKRRFWICAALLLLLALPVRGAYDLPQTEQILYGTSGEGRDLMAYRFGSGENVLVMCFAIHGYEDNWNRDGLALVETAEALMEHLEESVLPDEYGWTVYVLPCLNPDGLYGGWTNDGPGRCTTTYIDADGDLVQGEGIDMNRCFPTYFQELTSLRNRTTQQPMACREARALAEFIQRVKGSGSNLLIDVHGWLQMNITTSSRILSVLHETFPENRDSLYNGGTGYLSTYAHALGYESALLELPDGYRSLSQYRSGDCIDRILATVDGLMRTQPATCGTGGHQYALTQITAPSCGQVGSQCEVCSICGKTRYTTLAALEHQADPDTLQILTAATACRSGLYGYQCSRCGGEMTQWVPSFFADVDSEGFYADAVDHCYNAGYIKGTTAYTFEPDTFLSRAMLVTILHRFAGEPQAQQAAPFQDLAADGYYVSAVNWAYGTGVVLGTGETTFSPDDPVTRQQAMAIFHRYVEGLGIDNGERETGDFSDLAELDPYARDPAAWSVANGIILGDDTGRLNPRSNMTRAEAVTVLTRVMAYLQ